MTILIVLLQVTQVIFVITNDNIDSFIASDTRKLVKNNINIDSFIFNICEIRHLVGS